MHFIRVNKRGKSVLYANLIEQSQPQLRVYLDIPTRWYKPLYMSWRSRLCI